MSETRPGAATVALPVDETLADLRTALATQGCAVLVAPPGAGKTTRVPLALLDEPWLAGRKIIVLEPRRLAARAAADRMASTLATRVGGIVGLRARLASKSGRDTRIEVVTEGVFTRMILDDPTLSGIGAVIFDEFHERSLEADLALALTLDCRSGLREDLRILVMSATLDGAKVAGLIGNAPVIESEGRGYPIDTHYLGRDPAQRLDAAMAAAIARATRANSGSVLAFLPGQGEIRRLATLLAERIDDPDIAIAPLYGAMDLDDQRRAIAPAPPGKRKIVLATSVAETSLTIEGVNVVVDCGLARVPRFEPGVAVSRLETVRVSRAAADQRRGRAGRLGPGVCYRLWDAAETTSLPAYAEPEIRAADLAPLLLAIAEWGVTNPADLAWLDPPPVAGIAAARETLVAIGALDADGRLTAHGRAVRALPLPPRLAHMVLAATATGDGRQAARLAAVIVERGVGGTATDVDQRLDGFARDRSRRTTELSRLAAAWAESAARHADPRVAPPKDQRPASTAALLALAYPDRIAKARGAPGQFLLASGRGANLDPADPLARERHLVVAELQGAAAATRILLAARLDAADIPAIAGDRIEKSDVSEFDPASAAVRTRRTTRLGAIVLASEPQRTDPGPDTADALAAGIARLGLDRLPWTPAQAQLRARVAFLRQAAGEAWPDLSDESLGPTVNAWLAPHVVGRTALSEVTADDLARALDGLLPYATRRNLDREAPTHFEAPTGNRFAIDYQGSGAPAVHLRVQELFGLTAHPTVAQGRLPLTLYLLSPASRPIQVTRDLPGFWAGSWRDVRAELRGRYPRHPWPEDPASASPTSRAKPRGT